jgi:hypothetical protein
MILCFFSLGYARFHIPINTSLFFGLLFSCFFPLNSVFNFLFVGAVIRKLIPRTERKWHDRLYIHP